MKMTKWALEITTIKNDTKEICTCYCQRFETEEELDQEVEILWNLKDAYKKTHTLYIEYVSYLDRVHGRN
jgi:hypothetical protein